MKTNTTDLICTSQQIESDKFNRNILYNVTMVTLADRVTRMRESLGLKQSEIAEALNMAQQSYSDIEHGKSKRPRRIEELAKILKTTPEWLLFGTGPDTQPLKIIYTIPIFSWANIVQYLSCVEAQVDMEKISMEEPGYENCGALRVANDLMEPDFKAGDVIIFEKDREPKNGNFVIAYKENAPEAMFKQYVVDGADKYLYSKKTGLHPIKLDDTIKIIGVVVRMRAPDKVILN